MEYFGVLAFIMILFYSSYPGKVKKLESKVKLLSKKQKGESYMSKLIGELVGKECIIKSDAGLELIGSNFIKCRVLDVDDEWLKICFIDKKKKEVTKLLRIESIDEVEMTEQM